MSDWGVPNWRDSAEYGDVKCWSLVRWRWEFTRRLADYRQDACDLIALSDQVENARLHYRQDLTPETKEKFLELNEKMNAVWDAYFKRWGFSECLDPCVSKYPDEHLLTWPKKGVAILAGRHASVAGHGELTIRFNLSEPVLQQMEMAERIFRQKQKEFLGNGVDKPHLPKDKARVWLEYLRVLDGHDAKKNGMPNAPANWEEIGTVIYRGEQGMKDRARKAHTAALKVADNI